MKMASEMNVTSEIMKRTSKSEDNNMCGVGWRNYTFQSMILLVICDVRYLSQTTRHPPPSVLKSE